jgi:hypothetical protein
VIDFAVFMGIARELHDSIYAVTASDACSPWSSPPGRPSVP